MHLRYTRIPFCTKVTFAQVFLLNIIHIDDTCGPEFYQAHLFGACSYYLSDNLNNCIDYIYNILPSHEHISYVCPNRMYGFLLDEYPHWLHLWSQMFSWTVILCAPNFAFVLVDYPHWWHLRSRIFSCTSSWYLFILSFWPVE